MERVYIGLGSNIGNRERNLREAVNQLVACDAIELKKVSSVYFCEPIGGPPQPWYYNAAAEVTTSLDPPDMLSSIHQIEVGMGRTSGERNVPRTIDLDILFFGNRIIDTDELKVPHPRLLERRFVLEPLVEIAADLVHPTLGETMEEWLRKLRSGGTVVKKGTLYDLR